MNTTALLAEVFIVGLVGALWLAFVSFSVFGYEWVSQAREASKGWEALLTVVFIAVLYTIGVFVDRVADCLFLLVNPERLLMRFQWVREKARVAHADARMSVFAREGRATEFLEHIRSRIRVARAAALNAPLIAVALSLFLIVRTEYGSVLVVSATLLIGALATTVSVLV